LSQVSSSLFKQQFNDGIKIGLYFWKLICRGLPSSGGLTVDILDTKTGEQTHNPKSIIWDYIITFFYWFFIHYCCGAYYNQPTGIEKGLSGK
jgi:hypothetical protein